MKTTKYVAYDLRDNDNYGDLVECCNCEEIMLVNKGTDDCPMCKKKGSLKWADEIEEWNGTENELVLI